MKKLFTFLLLFNVAFAQNSYIVVEAQYDSYGIQESSFEILDNSGVQLYFHQPTVEDEYLIDTLWIDAGSYIVNLYDQYGDGWQETSLQGHFRIWNSCQDTIVEFLCSSSNYFATETIPFMIGECSPNAPPVPCVPATVIINLDQYQNETSWQIADTNGMVVASGSGYGAEPDYGTVVVPVCIPQGDFTFTIIDSYGDGLQGTLWQGEDGSYFLKQCNDTLVYGTNPAFGLDSIHSFVSDSCPPVLGCTNIAYLEYNPFADVDDNSCETLAVFGCTDSTMYNYESDANAMLMFPQCQFKLVLEDLVGNGWVASSLDIVTPDASYNFTHTGGFTDVYYIDIPTGTPVTAVFNIDGQASLTTIECGFTLINPDGDTVVERHAPFIQPLLPYTGVAKCNNQCVDKTYGCIDDTALNYNDSINTDDGSCYYVMGCMNPIYLEYNPLADFDNQTCETPVVIGCMDDSALNYNSEANTELEGSCIEVVEGCTDETMFNYNINANQDNGSCYPYMYGCMDVSALNYDSLANTDDGGCIAYIWGCTDGTAFNYNPLANSDDGTCIDVVFGCTDNTMWNYDATANTDNNSCVGFYYGCTDSLALNYDILANTNNGSCVYPLYGCLDASAINYNTDANLSDSSCYYSANCSVGDIYYIPNSCFEWVIDVDSYCCNIEWDETCESLYSYCIDGWSGTTDIDNIRGSVLAAYPNPTSATVNFTDHVDVQVYNMAGALVKDEHQVTSVLLTINGLYLLHIKYKGMTITTKINKQ